MQEVERSIFLTIKGMLGSDADYDVFDQDIIVFINSALATLTQLGIGPSTGFRISGETETWNDLLGEYQDLDSVKSYIYMKVKIAFDPPSSSAVLNAYQEACKEYEWRLNVAVDPSRLDIF